MNTMYMQQLRYIKQQFTQKTSVLMPWKVKTELLVKNIEHFTTKKQLLKKNYLSEFLVLHDLWNNICELHRQVYLVLQLVGCTYFGKMTVFWLPALEGQPLSDITESTVPGLWNTYNICHGNTLYSIYRFLYQLVSVMWYIFFSKLVSLNLMVILLKVNQKYITLLTWVSLGITHLQL